MLARISAVLLFTDCESGVLITVRIVFLPSPGVSAHLFERLLRLPAELPLCFRGIRIAGRNIARAALLKDIVDLQTRLPSRMR